LPSYNIIITLELRLHAPVQQPLPKSALRGEYATVIKDGIMYVQAGAGIVNDSVPESEFQECHHKARALIRAAQEAVLFAQSGSRNR